MSILNQSITPLGQPAFPSKGSSSQENFQQQLPMAPSLHRSLSLKSSQLMPLRKTTLNTESGSPAEGDPLDIKNQRQNGMLESISDSVWKLSQLLNNNGYFSFINWPITPTEQGNALKTVNSTELKPLTVSFLRSLMENEKINLTKDVMEGPDLYCIDPSDTLIVAVSSAVKLECKQMDQIARKMQRVTGFKNIRLGNTIDPSLIAGFVITYEKEGSHVIDLSVKGQLAELEAQIESTDQSCVSHAKVKFFE